MTTVSVSSSGSSGSSLFEPRPDVFGAWTDIDITRPLSVEDIAAIAAAFHRHLFAIFRNADLSFAQLAAFLDSFGFSDSPTDRLANAAEGYSGIRVVENVDRDFNAAGKPMIRPGGVQVENVLESTGIETPIIQVRRHTCCLRAVAGGENHWK